ncbi:MAG: acetyltransferase [Alphaproteobacteria bacterium]|nr:acetyltransferase [Alphaproteobacteria bacterium]
MALCAYEYFTHDSEYEVSGFVVDGEYIKDGQDSFMGLPLVPFEEIEAHFPPSSFHAFAAIGSQKLNRVRTEKYEALKAKGYNMASYISSRAFIWHNVEVGDNAFILEDNTIQPFVKIGNNVTLWSGNHIGHSSVIGDNCFITSQVVISGLCNIGKSCFMGVNSSCSEETIIGDDNFIAIGAVVSKNTDENVLIPPPSKTEPSKIPAKRFCRVK